jgi:hypothetical protein
MHALATIIMHYHDDDHFITSLVDSYRGTWTPFTIGLSTVMSEGATICLLFPVRGTCHNKKNSRRKKYVCNKYAKSDDWQNQ